MCLTDLDSSDFNIFCQEHNISLAILFGSQATGRASPGSDFDLAVWLEGVELLPDVLESARAKRQLLRDIINYLKTGNIDLVVLNHASPLLKFQVARTGRPLYQKTKGLFADFCSRALREHNDARVFYQATEDYLRREIERSGADG